MRRCPDCQSPNPDGAGACAACGQALAPLPREPWLRLRDVWHPAALRRALLALAVLLAFRLSFGGLLTAGFQRQEWRFAAFHLMHGVLLGLGLAWVRGLRLPTDWLLWAAMGLAGGLLSEALEVWFTYRHLVSTLSVLAWNWFGLESSPALVYQMLQTLRLAGTLLPLGALALAGEKRPIRALFLLLMVLAGWALRMPMRGAYLQWAALGGSLGWQHLGLYAGSGLCLLYGLGQRALTESAPSR